MSSGLKIHVALIAVLGFTCCSAIAPPAKPGTVDHIVLVWLKRPGNEADKQTLLRQGRELRAIPGIRFLDSGHALPSDRSVVDDSFDLAYVMRFDSPAALEAYGSHPLHLKAREELLRLSRKVVIHDITR